MNRRDFIVGSGIVAASTSLSLPLFAGEKWDGPEVVLLKDFPAYKQETPYTCGPSSCRMVLSYLGREVPEAEIAKKMCTKKGIGTTNYMYMHAYKKYLKEMGCGLAPRQVTGKKADLDLVREKLTYNGPIVASFLTENYFKPGTAVGHYCVIIGCDVNRNVFTLANPFGYHEEMDIERFWRLAKWTPKEGDIPGVPYKKTPRFHLPKTLIVLERKG